MVLLDIRREPDERDRRLLSWLGHYDIPMQIVLTKTDKVTRQEAVLAQRDIAAALGAGVSPLLTSATSGQGIAQLRAAIARHLEDRPG